MEEACKPYVECVGDIRLELVADLEGDISKDREDLGLDVTVNLAVDEMGPKDCHYTLAIRHKVLADGPCDVAYETD